MVGADLLREERSLGAVGLGCWGGRREVVSGVDRVSFRERMSRIMALESKGSFGRVEWSYILVLVFSGGY